MGKITPFLWFDDDLEQALAFYASVFPHATIGEVSRYGEGGPAPSGTVISATFELEGQQFIALNGGPGHGFTDAVSFLIRADTQEEIDRLWERLTEDGGQPGPCGWLKDKFGLSWQVVPSVLTDLLSDPDPGRAGRAMAAMLQMSRLDIAALQAAADAVAP
jgi:predicted 3-demethylubiquinone-9 3-methyltransferase (glyoxalase superfamily)